MRYAIQGDKGHAVDSISTLLLLLLRDGHGLARLAVPGTLAPAAAAAFSEASDIDLGHGLLASFRRQPPFNFLGQFRFVDARRQPTA